MRSRDDGVATPRRACARQQVADDLLGFDRQMLLQIAIHG